MTLGRRPAHLPVRPCRPLHRVPFEHVAERFAATPRPARARPMEPQLRTGNWEEPQDRGRRLGNTFDPFVMNGHRIDGERGTWTLVVRTFQPARCPTRRTPSATVRDVVKPGDALFSGPRLTQLLIRCSSEADVCRKARGDITKKDTKFVQCACLK